MYLKNIFWILENYVSNNRWWEGLRLFNRKEFEISEFLQNKAQILFWEFEYNTNKWVQTKGDHLIFGVLYKAAVLYEGESYWLECGFAKWIKGNYLIMYLKMNMAKYVDIFHDCM